ncbi:MAG: NAD-dependent epimerase/dehydratase family protein, partial [Alphaproteobacteria bacterium]|nr:NAD-dependent epimerase/dehydratase family protein [Alphaproteobacteria bacterium]
MGWALRGAGAGNPSLGVTARAVVTGATGLIGRQVLAPLAARGFEVHAVARRGGESPAAIWHGIDLLDLAAARSLMADI